MCRLGKKRNSKLKTITLSPRLMRGILVLDYGSSIHFTVWSFCPRGVVWVILTHTTFFFAKVVRLIFNQTTSRGEFRPMKITWSKEPSDFSSPSLYIRHENAKFVLSLKKYFSTVNFVANCDKVKEKAIPHIRLLRTNMVEWLCKKY